MRTIRDDVMTLASVAVLTVAGLTMGCVAPVLTGATGTTAGSTAATAGGQSAADSAQTAAVSSATQTAATETVKAGIEDRSTADQATDLKINAAIQSDLIGEDSGLFLDVGADVWEQRVLLTGTVEKSEQKAKAGELVTAVTDVKQVINEIIVTEESGGLSGAVDDKVVTSKIEVKLLAADDVNSLNYRYRSVGGTVFLFGRALTPEEHDKVKGICADTEDVTEVISHVVVGPLEG